MKIGVAVRVRDENKIICDFIKHYIKLEFDRIIIYDYNSINKVSNILQNNKLLFENIIIIEKDYYIENDTYHKAINMNKDLDWLFLCDCDEFLYLKEGSIKNFLEKFDNNVSTILVNWVVFGCNNLLKYDINKTIFEQFTAREQYNHFWNLFTKSIVRPKFIDTSNDNISTHIIESKNYLTKNVYNAIPKYIYYNACQCHDIDLSDNTPLVIFHYMTLDLESMLEKKKKYESIGVFCDRYTLKWYYNYEIHPPQSFKDDVYDDRMKKFHNID